MHKYRYIVILVLLLAGKLLGQVNGELIQMEDKKILHVWGNHYQRGYAQGYLLAAEIKDVFLNYYYVMHSYSDPQTHAANLSSMNNSFSFDNRYVTECSGIADGLAASASGAYFAGLGRNLDTDDILMLNTTLDMSYLQASRMEYGCASLASWDMSTLADESLLGSAVITRFLDWTPNSSLLANPLLIVHHPSEPDEQKWLNFTYPGLIGALSAVNQAGTAAFMNTGNDHYYTITQGLSPILFSIRSGLERLDTDGNGSYDADDLYHSLSTSTSLGGFIIQNLTETDSYFHSSVIEKNNGGTARRLYNQNGNLPGWHLAATNHFRYLSYPTCCTRYSSIQDSLYANSAVTAKRQWQVLAGAAGMENNLMAIQYIPSQNYLLWSAAATNQPAYLRPGLTLNTQQLFDLASSTSDDTYIPNPSALRVYPNPVRSSGILRVESSANIKSLRIYNSRGQEIHRATLEGQRNYEDLQIPASYSNGIYLVKIEDSQGKQSVQKLLVVK